MRVVAMFETGDAYVDLSPENDREKLLLGSILSDKTVGEVKVRYEGHQSWHKAEFVRIILREAENA